MTTLMRFRNLEKSFGAKTVFSELAGEVNSGQIIGLVGENGCGKSTLLRILAGLAQADGGRIESPSPTFCTAYLPQELDESDSAVVTFVSSGHAKLWCIEQELRVIEAAMAETGESVLGDLLERYGRLSTDFESAGGYKLQPMAEAALLDVGLPQDLWHKPLSELSGGQKTRASLARALVKNPDLLLLDEPTNYLDFAGLAWLEHWVKKSGRTVMIVSHDRYFLDKTATHIWDLKRGGLHFYKGNYSDYRRQKEQQLLEQSEAYEAHIAEKRRLREIVERQMKWFTAAHDAAGQNDFWRAKAKKLAKRAKAVASRLEQEMENSVERPKEKNQVFVRFAAPENLGDLLIGAQELKFSYGSKEVLREVDFTLHGGERVALFGANGAGKTTFLKLLLGQLYPTKGQLQRSKVAEIGYFSQERSDLDLGKTALDELLTVEGLDKATAWYLLGRLGFRGNEALKILSTCSLGERAKVSLAKLLVGKYHVLVLDEPTNHLDINSRERMEEALKAYPGALILVSHDRYFMDSVVNQVYHLENGHLTRYLGNYSYYECKIDTKPEEQEANELRILLQTRLARLASMLANQDKQSVEYADLERLYNATSRELLLLSSSTNA